ncbi:MAG: hypothetical protein OXC07_10250 [Kistimonas sp.]|nr:hypothetical protein [Kistimonas sp.]
MSHPFCAEACAVALKNAAECLVPMRHSLVSRHRRLHRENAVAALVSTGIGFVGCMTSLVRHQLGAVTVGLMAIRPFADKIFVTKNVISHMPEPGSGGKQGPAVRPDASTERGGFILLYCLGSARLHACASLLARKH